MVTLSDATETARFTDIVLANSAFEGLENFTSRTRKIYEFSIVGPTAKAAETSLYAIESFDIRANDPVWNIAREADAVATDQGELVKVTLTLHDGSNDGEDVTASGIITDVVFNAASNARNQRLDFLLRVCHTLKVDPQNQDLSLAIPIVEVPQE